MAERIYIDAKHIWFAIQRLREANANMNMVENEIARVISEYGIEAKEYYNGKCPYTDKPCEDWKCNECKVEQEEQNCTNCNLARWDCHYHLKMCIVTGKVCMQKGWCDKWKSQKMR